MTETLSTNGDGATPKVIGVVGGIASGKSAVADILSGWGAEHFNADQAGHEALQQPAVVHQLRKRFGDSILDDAGQVHRPALAKRVFAEGEEAEQDLAFLNFVTHPWIRAAFQRHHARCKAPVLLLDAALLLEAEWASFCDEVLFVDTSAEIRRERAAARGWTAEQWEQRESAQMPLNEKRQQATHVVANNETIAVLRSQLALLAHKWGLARE